MNLGQLLHHLAMCPGAFVAAINNAFPPAEAMQKFMEEDLRNSKAPDVAGRELSRGWDEPRAALSRLSDADFQGKPVAVPWGPPMPLWRACLDMAEHWANHKYQLFFSEAPRSAGEHHDAVRRGMKQRQETRAGQGK